MFSPSVKKRFIDCLIIRGKRQQYADVSLSAWPLIKKSAGYILLKRLVDCTMNPVFFSIVRNMHLTIYLKLGSVNSALWYMMGIKVIVYFYMSKMLIRMRNRHDCTIVLKMHVVNLSKSLASLHACLVV